MAYLQSTSSFRPVSDGLKDKSERFDSVKDAVLLAVVCATAAAAILVVLTTLLVLLDGAMRSLDEIGLATLLASSEWFPTVGEFGLSTMMASTAAVSIGALAVVLPASVLLSLLLCFYLPPYLSGMFRTLIQLLAAIPSVVYGLWGLVVLVPLIARLGGQGACLLAGLIVLAIMVIPTVTVIIETAIRQLHPSIYQGALALGISRHRAMLRVVLPAIKGRIFASMIIGLTRAIGETMALVMVMGNSTGFPEGLLSSARTLSSNIALEMAYAVDVHHSALFASGLVLMILVVAMLALVDVCGKNGGEHASA
jgi:phosphate transport system permease protein